MEGKRDEILPEKNGRNPWMAGKYRPGDEEICTPAPLAVVDCAFENAIGKPTGYPQSSSIYRWSFPKNQPAIGSSSMGFPPSSFCVNHPQNGSSPILWNFHMGKNTWYRSFSAFWAYPAMIYWTHAAYRFTQKDAEQVQFITTILVGFYISIFLIHFPMGFSTTTWGIYREQLYFLGVP